jgi:hypothetical protein
MPSRGRHEILLQAAEIKQFSCGGEMPGSSMNVMLPVYAAALRTVQAINTLPSCLERSGRQ